jgi:hypothetical protein
MPKRIRHWTISKTRIHPLVKIFSPAHCERTQVSLNLHEVMDGITISYILILYIFGQKTDTKNSKQNDRKQTSQKLNSYYYT